MVAPSFDSTHAVTFDLGSGSVRAAGQEERLVLLPAAALANLLLYASAEAGVALGRALGDSIGRRVAAHSASAVSPSVEEFATRLAGEAALAGAGVFSLERWGRALVVVIEQSPLAAPLLAPLVGAALEAYAKRKVAAALLAHDERASRILVASERGVERVRGWMMAGTAWGDALVKLHGGAS